MTTYDFRPDDVVAVQTRLSGDELPRGTVASVDREAGTARVGFSAPGGRYYFGTVPMANLRLVRRRKQRAK